MSFLAAALCPVVGNALLSLYSFCLFSLRHVGAKGPVFALLLIPIMSSISGRCVLSTNPSDKKYLLFRVGLKTMQCLP